MTTTMNPQATETQISPTASKYGIRQFERRPQIRKSSKKNIKQHICVRFTNPASAGHSTVRVATRLENRKDQI